MERYEVLDIGDIIELHNMLIRDFGGAEGLFPDTEERVGSILQGMFSEYFGYELYPGLFNKASYLLYSLIKNHCFPDGNKRIAFNSTEIFLYLNGYELKTEQYDFALLVEDIAGMKRDDMGKGEGLEEIINELAKILKENSEKITD